MDVAYDVTIRVLDEEAFRRQAFVSDPDLEPGATIEEIVRAVMVDPAEPPLECGYEIMNASVFRDGADGFRVNVMANVLDEDLLAKAAAKSYERAWGESGWTPETTAEALYEHVFGSNAQPPTLDVGFEVMSTNLERQPSSPAP